METPVTPDQLMALKAISDILRQVGTWPFGTVLLVAVLGPWIFSFLAARSQEKRLEQAIRMYEDNIQLVKDYKELVQAYQKGMEGQQDLIIHTTQTLTHVKNIAENNLYCPWVRKNTQETREPRG